ncbi:endolytic transglycosylase MltG [Clostridium perfringens]|uniref:endolytic transglycosylase MltG n=1 Tax=Clostridium perfringens TaxID=1502 RepID=UPI0024BC7B0B|nr:endolytic transglycosylase MltG [Clostridium perfringens]MDM0711096.1 endolytic transglycosylase MltG [Clostridium perfringens]
MKRLKNSKSMVLISIFIILLVINLAVFVVKYNSIKRSPLQSNKADIIFKVKEGESLNGLFERLNNENVLRSSFFSKIYIKFNNVEESIKPGTYTVNSDISFNDFLSVLTDGKVSDYKVTFPEGYTVEDIAKKLEESKVCTKDEFLKVVKEYPLPSYIKPNNERKYELEGFLFPDTYAIPKGTTPKQIIEMMLNRFEGVISEIQSELGITIPKEEYEKYVIVASMVEKEARDDSERAEIASVIYNRLQKGMPLQIDATVLYALGEHKDTVLYKDLKVDSPYNTYKIKGLPVGPICNPGKPSLLAAIKPAKTDYIYYLLNPSNNKHYFTNNYEDFLAKKKEFGY